MKNLISLISLFLINMLVHVHGQNDPLLRHAMVTVNPVPDYEVFAPSPIPDRIVLTWSDNPANTQTVTWRTDISVERAFGQIAISTSGPLFRDETIYATTRSLETNLGKANYHSVLFKNLEPDTRYIYRVGDGMNWSEWIEFKTASNTFEPFTFIYMGDSQEDVRSQWSRVVRNAFRDAPESRFFLHAGDLVDNAHNDGEWGEWFEAQGFIPRMTPVIPVTGNHEHHGRLSDQWRYQFNLPENGPEELLGSTYYIDVQNVRIIVLNSSMHLSRYQGSLHNLEMDYIQNVQTNWLKKVLEQNNSRWTIVAFHHPPYPSQRGRLNKEIYDQWKPIFETYNVDLVLNGHEHSYYRTNSQRKDGISDSSDTKLENDSENDGGTVYVVSHSGSKTRKLNREDWMVRAGEDIQLFHTVRVEEEKIHFESKTATGKIYDAFTILKKDNNPNVIIDRIPSLEEMLRGEDSILPETLRPWFYHERRFVDPPRR